MIPILLYHSVDKQVAPGYRRWAVHPERFATQMAILHAEGYTPITVTELVTAMQEPERFLPPRPILLTFDDGLADFYTGALPILQHYGFVATLYVATGFVGERSRWLEHAGEGKRPMLTWEQIIELNQYGIECGAHTHTHPELDTLSLAEAYDEIERSKKLLEAHLGQAVSTFAYPHGYYSSQVRQFVREAGFTSACAVKHAMSRITDDPFALARLIVEGETDEETFRGWLVGRGVRVAPQGERKRTKVWRELRRLKSKWR